MKDNSKTSKQSKARREAFCKVQSLLVEKDSSFRKWALENDYHPRTVTQTVSRYAGGTDLPIGRLSFRILVKLSNALEHEIVPGIFKYAAEDAA